MIIKQHKQLGLWISSDGRVVMPPDGHRFFKFRWTYGSKNKCGYLVVRFRGKLYYVHRLVAQTFLGEIPEGCQIDHVSRVRDDNRLENIRIVTRSENRRNTADHDRVTEQGRTHKYEDARQFNREWRAKNPERQRAYDRAHRARNPECVRASSRKYRAKQKALGKHRRTCPDGKRRLLTDEEYEARFGNKPQ